MSDNPDYIKDIEKYFLSLAGEGIMLSSMDYNLIRDWKKRGVPKELVLRGINRAFSDRDKKESARSGFQKGLRQCAEYVEKCVIDFRPGYAGGGVKRGQDIVPGGIVGEAAEKLGRMVDAEKNKTLRDYYAGLRLKILRLGQSESENLLKTLSELEEESMDEFFNGLPEGEKEKIILDAEGMLKGRARYMTDSAYRESLISFRNEILGSRYGIKGVIQ